MFVLQLSTRILTMSYTSMLSTLIAKRYSYILATCYTSLATFVYIIIM